ncbi:MAG: hypothetical protein IKB88_10295 [Clostridia bacterium]|nr:hypothetical protein [Clostridia bacterium]
MSIILKAVIDENRSLVVSPSDGYSGEHNSEMLEIDIGPFADGDYDFFIINFENFATKGKFTSNVIRTENDTPSYIDNGVIFCPVTAQMTASGRLRIQLEAHKSTENGAMVRKSSVAELSFGESLMGAQDMMDSSDPVHERLDTVEERLDGIDAQNFGASIDSISKKVDVLEGNIQNTVSDVEDAQRRIAAVEDYKISQTFEDFEERITVLEEKPDGLDSLPVASENTLGGVKVNNIRYEIGTDENGALKLIYGNMNKHLIGALVVLSMLYQASVTEVFASESEEEVSSWLFENSMNILSNNICSVAFVMFGKGQVQYYDENFFVKDFEALPNVIYTVKMVDGVMTITPYFGTEWRKLITEGI